MSIHYEQLEGEAYQKAHDRFESIGLAIPDGAAVELSEWGKQNLGSIINTKLNTYTKVGNAEKKSFLIKLLKNNAGTPKYFWAGFWKEKTITPNNSHLMEDEKYNKIVDIFKQYDCETEEDIYKGEIDLKGMVRDIRLVIHE